jgi:signal transduction histidine kinase
MIDRVESDLSQIVSDEVHLIQEVAKARDIGIAYHMPSHFPRLYLDTDKMRQVIMNFLDNAVYYSPEHTTISVRLYTSDGFAMCEIIDHGMGVPPDAQAKLFSKFFRAENAKRQRPDGTGIGLYLAKKVIDGHGGKVLFSTVEGEGSTFGFRLPIKKLSTDTVTQSGL